ncbi:catechol 2,3-dioxygenase-like lactoylglutathione lyase family enzyme [Actinoplanes tereljensis]|uniref:Glyoxalase n=1 Tax=Paractinoplanes tereljensis TaxID=571912 RepID=A0A919NKC6_9ACTN|nr:VOC family protein [Actinoplanes tereljensis]GIF20349.1 glyoxalase [Actinoplanes tereljensis]
MGIQRIESVVYTVDDLETCVRFFTDFGLDLLGKEEKHATFETRIGQTLHLRAGDDDGLPPPVESGNTLREVVWGAEDEDDLAAFVAAVGTDREVTRDAGGVFHTVDETGFGVGLTVAGASKFEPVGPRAANVTGFVNRVNQALSTVGAVRPLRMCHVALNIPKDGREEAVAFYVDRLGFIPTDVVKPMGVFMRVPGDADQHNFLLCHRPDKAGVNHVSFEAPGFDDVIEGGNHMIEKGWQEARRLGRHTVGSNVFRFVHAPCGGRVELAADMDRVDDTYGTRVHETAPPHHIWTLRTSREQS